MTTLQAILAVVVALFVLAGLGGGIWASFRSTDQDARIKRLQSERDDLLSRLNFIEPKVKTLEEQNQILLGFHNPAEQIAALREQESTNHQRTYALLTKQHDVLQQIDAHLQGREKS